MLADYASDVECAELFSRLKRVPAVPSAKFAKLLLQHGRDFAAFTDPTPLAGIWGATPTFEDIRQWVGTATSLTLSHQAPCLA